jgi:WD40 repeat protein/ABC-type branched-subunit amino acid transport system substrate-binding protein/energy-coupling factor transporter ATP-binding protein EcfA2
MVKTNLRNIAVVIGIDKYAQGISHLGNAVKDAKEIARVLEEKHNYNVRHQLFDESATLDNLITLLEKELPNEIDENDRLVFYFAGHGKRVTGENGPTGYFIPQDGKQGDESTFLKMTQLHDLLTSLKCRHFLGIFDCCFAGAFRWSIATRASDEEEEQMYKEQHNYYLENSVWQVLLSAAHDEEANDSYINTKRGESKHRSGHSPFAAALLDALENGEADVFPQATANTPKGDGITTAAEIHAYLSQVIPTITANNPQQQTPSLESFKEKHEKGEFMFDTPGHPKNWKNAVHLNEETNPYKSLKAFEKEDADCFFGRDRVIKDLHVRVSKDTITVVIGASGSGKSSLVKAGLIPKLEKEQWQIINPIRPGKYPIEELKKSLIESNLIDKETSNQQISCVLCEELKKQPDKRILLCIDQCEELITLCANKNEAKDFLRQIVDASINNPQQLHVVLTLRSDFEPQFHKYLPEQLPEKKWKETRFNIPTMMREELREAIEKPAAKMALYFKPHSLIDNLIDEVYNTPGALPLLSFALSELYLSYLGRQKREGNKIDRAISKEDYEELGGVTVALSSRADKIYDKLISEQKPTEEQEKTAQIIKNVMLRMVTLSSGSLARRRVPESELQYPQTKDKNKIAQHVIKIFTKERLLVQYTDKDIKGNEITFVEPAHDALVTKWQKLLDWKDAEDNNLFLQRRLTPQAELWDNQKQTQKQTQTQTQTQKQKQAAIITKSQEFITRTELVLDWTLRKIYSTEILLEQTKNAVLRLWREQEKQQEKQQENNLKEPKQFLWHNDPYIDVLEKELKSGQDWFNELEANFIWSSIKWKRFIANSLALGGTGLFIFMGFLTYNALRGEREAQLGRMNASRQTAEFSLAANRDLESVRQILRAGKPLKGGNITDWLFFNIFNQDTDFVQNQARVKSTLQKILYRNRERNRIQVDRAGVYGMAFHPEQNILATVGDKSTIRVWKKNGDTTEQIDNIPGGSGNELAFVNYGKNNYCNADVKNDKNLKLVNFGDRDKIQLWNIEENGKINIASGLTLNPKPNLDSRKNIKKVVLSPDGRFLALLFENQKDSTTPAGMKLLSIDYTGHKIQDKKCEVKYKDINIKELQEAKTVGIAFNSSGNLMATFENSSVKLWNTSGQLLETFSTGQKAIESVAFSPDGKKIATVGKDSDVQQWQIETETNNQGQITKINKIQQNNSFSTFQRIIQDVAYNHDGNQLATIGEDSILRLWDSSGQKKNLIQPLEGYLPDAQLKTLAFSPDGKQLATIIGNDTVRLWDRSGNPIARFPKSTQHLKTVFFSTDGQYIATLTEGDGVLQWHDTLGNKVKDSQIKTDLRKINIKNIAISPNRKQFAVVRQDGFIELRNNVAQNSKNLLTTEFDKRTKAGIFESVAFSPDSNVVAGGTRDGRVFLWNQQGKKIGEFCTGHQVVSNVAFSPDATQLATAGRNRDNLRIWNIPDKYNFTKECRKNFFLQLITYQQAINSLAFNPWDGKKIITGGMDGTVREWNISENQTMQFSTGEGESVNNLTFNADSKILVTVGANNKVKFWDVLNDGFVRIRNANNTELDVLQNNEQFGILNVTFSPQRDKLAILSKNNIVSLWDISGRKLNELPPEKTSITSVTFSNDGNFIATKGENDTVKLWQIDNGNPKQLIPENKKLHENISSIQLSPDGQLLVIAGDKGRVKIYSKSSFERPKDEFQTQQEIITNIAFSSDGKELATAGQDGTVRLWDISGNDKRTIKTDQKNKIYRVMFSADDKQIVTVGNNLIRLWDTSSGEQIQQFTSERKDIISAGFSPDGKHLAIGTNKGNISLLRVGSIEDLQVEICKLVQDYLASNADVDQNDRQLCQDVPVPIGRENLSRGEKILVREASNFNKSKGTEAFKNGSFERARWLLQESLKQKPNDPETRIYWNNASIGNQPSYTIAVSVPLGSQVTNDVNGALEILRGVAQAQDEINNGTTKGINGKLLKIIITDDENNPETAKQVAKELSNNPEVLGVVGHYASSITKVAGEIYKQSKLPVISPVSTSVDLSKFGKTNIFGLGEKYFFRTVPSDKEAASKLAEYMRQKNITNAVVFYNSKSEYSSSLKEEFVKNVNQNQVAVQIDIHNLSKPDFNPSQVIDEIKSAKNKFNPQTTALVLLPDTTMLDNALEVVKYNNGEFPMLAGDDVYTPKTLSAWRDLPQVSDIKIAVPWHIGLHRNTQFVEKSYKLWHAPVNWRTTMSYDATKALITGIQKKPSRQGIAKILSSDKFITEGATGKVEFLSCGDRKQMKNQLVEILPTNPSPSKYGFDFAPVNDANPSVNKNSY